MVGCICMRGWKEGAAIDTWPTEPLLALSCAAGIGFKATAVMSEVTYISSNGYHFCFDMRKGTYPIPGLGLVCPRWMEDLPSKLDAWIQQKAKGGMFQHPS